MYKKVITEVDADMRGEGCISPEEDQVPYCKVFPVNCFTEVELFTGTAGEVSSGKAEDPLRRSRRNSRGSAASFWQK